MYLVFFFFFSFLSNCHCHIIYYYKNNQTILTVVIKNKIKLVIDKKWFNNFQMECAVCFCLWRHFGWLYEQNLHFNNIIYHSTVTNSTPYLFFWPRQSPGAVDECQTDGNRINEKHAWWTEASCSHRCWRATQHSSPIMWKAEGGSWGSRTAHRRHSATVWLRVCVRACVYTQ